jgi:23S rRNA pseudouridine1911/1915/1917 synthase
MEISGRKDGEGGLLHRLDYETQGLVLFAKNQQSFNHLLEQQEEGNFIKEYNAICQIATAPNLSFQPPPFTISSVQDGCVIESSFRPFGPGRKQVRPIIRAMGDKAARGLVTRDQGTLYHTEIAGCSQTSPDRYTFTVRLRRGFRHQVRCHLAWIGCPVLNDPLYGTVTNGGFLALQASGLIFTDPQNGQAREYRIALLEIP